VSLNSSLLLTIFWPRVDSERILLSATDDDFSSVAHLRIKHAELVPKPATLPGRAYGSAQWHEALKDVVTVPPLLDEEARGTLAYLNSVSSVFYHMNHYSN
jgi:hypothetical protein